jgi:two-component system, OmpR family, sensor histidine kinase VicK
MVERMELRHLEDIRGNFSISDKKTYRGTAAMREGKPPTEGIRSTTKVFVEQQQYFFETLWNKAILAKQRFNEIEQAAKREFVETIKDPYEIQKIGFDLIKRAEEVILILFSTANAFRRQAKAGALDLLKEVATLRGLKVRILVHVDDGDNKAKIIAANETIPQLKKLGIDIRQIKREEELYPLQNKLTMLIVDQSLCLIVESEEDKEETSGEEIGLATYSNSESTVFAYTSIFENSWLHTEMMGRHDSTTTHKQRLKNGMKTGRTTSAR